jgi:hypothetical protein
MGCGDVAYIHVVQDMAQWRALVITVINLRVPQNIGRLFDHFINK